MIISTVSTVRVLLACCFFSLSPFPLEPGSVKALSSFFVCEEGMPEFLAVFLVIFSKKIAKTNSNNKMNPSNKALHSGETLLSATSCLNVDFN